MARRTKLKELKKAFAYAIALKGIRGKSVSGKSRVKEISNILGSKKTKIKPIHRRNIQTIFLNAVNALNQDSNIADAQWKFESLPNNGFKITHTRPTLFVANKEDNLSVSVKRNKTCTEEAKRRDISTESVSGPVDSLEQLTVNCSDWLRRQARQVTQGRQIILETLKP